MIPKEEKLEIIKRGKQFSIGVPKETCLNERRTCIIPDAVQVLVANGHHITIEAGAGEEMCIRDSSCTGWGEFFIRATAARTIAAKIEYQNKDVKTAAQETIDEIEKLGGDG